MASKHPWKDRWKRGQELSKGGQGTTYLVTSKQGELFTESAVLKLLRNQKSPQARRRMFLEVANLRVLHSAGCSVPRVLDANTEKYEVSKIPLYFVMEYISGETLQNYVTKSSGLSIDESVQLILKMCDTLVIAQNEGILHRDIKPENIILKESNELVRVPVIVDYGLSFNTTDDQNITRGSETLDNLFLSLPERRVPGGDRRDPRSDLTGLCGILFFCLTTEAPVDLVGPDGNPPHRRHGKTLRERFEDSTQITLVEALLDQGLSSNLDTRFQTVDELRNRLKDILEPSARKVMEDPRLVAKKISQNLLKSDRRTQLTEYKSASIGLLQALKNCVHGYKKDEIPPFILGEQTKKKSELFDLDGLDDIGICFSCVIEMQNHPNRAAIEYQLAARGLQCAIFRATMKSTRKKAKFEVMEPWTPVQWYEGVSGPDIDIVIEDFKASLGEAMKLLEREILKSSLQPE